MSSHEHRPETHALAASPLFAGLEPESLAALDAALPRRRLAGGDTLFRQGERADAMYVVVRGRLEVILVEAGGRERLVDTLATGASVGEQALLLGETRTATVVAARDTDLVRIDQPAFDRLLAAHPTVAVAIARQLAQRLKRTTRRIAADARPRTITLVPISPGVPLDRVSAGLEAALEALVRADSGPDDAVCVVTPEEIEARFPGATTADLESEPGRRAGEWMSRLEENHSFVIQLVDPERPGWSRRCLRESDMTLLVADAGGSCDLSHSERALLPHDQRPGPVELLLLHAEGAPIRGTVRWLSPRRVVRHHHLRLGRTADVARLARRLTGRAVGLVLSGGGARGFAHVGVIRALHELGWPIDAVGGASMGAIIAALYATGHDADGIAEVLRREFVRRGDRDLTLPLTALTSAAATVRKMRRMYGEQLMEDLPLDLFCTSTNLTRAQPVVHDRGPVWLWTRTSCAIPGLAPPVPCDGDLLVDGGLLNNLPADVMRQRCDGVVVGVDVTAGVDLRWEGDLRPSLSGWRLLRERLAGRDGHFPTIVDILSRTALVASIRAAEHMRAHCDVCVTPAVETFGMAEFARIDALADAGYRAALAVLEAWPPRTAATAAGGARR
jgi:predicted acylesterase/phospholipase RssA/CRP-like cAMP-binding protein